MHSRWAMGVGRWEVRQGRTNLCTGPDPLPLGLAAPLPSATVPHLPSGMQPMHIETLAVHAGHDVDRATGAVTPPIHLSTTFGREAEGSNPGGFLYSRYANPNRAALEQCLAQLEGGAAAAAFASGSAATMTMLQAVGAGAHV